MRFGYVGTFGSAELLVQQAVAVEQHGWDGFFTWDALSIGADVTWDPWSLLAAVAVRTTRVRLGAMVFAPARHQPWTLARQVQTVDHLSGGRLVLPVGLGVDDDAAYSRVGPGAAGAAGSTTGAAGATDPDRRPVATRERAERLDDALEVLAAAAGGGPVTVHGRHSELRDVVLEPGTVQRPHVPVWVVGAWPSRRSIARAARWDGVVLQRLRSADPVDAAMVRDVLAEIRALRSADGRSGPYEVVLGQALPQDSAAAAEAARELEAAGVTWWVHADWSPSTSVEAHLDRIAQRPPIV
ncbi:LLM class flavin-dependent oxidoreductase [Actinotalea sp. M2MS4P-6]|uniref:LLM class flavin-dependent oxidoreductase n=1 Tax=Actinotalea sp. M2MS4P-6 TaxID=2983762 RepID=UPI0021E48A12|nr:LLM class flavin-dependent oxidoreductase [Actinotalea sp. M2MS4P-6]MCV2394000.1 LLM class flavin-dependent oxidoreductase [Actinotalea sp. M2MS4P-6]